MDKKHTNPLTLADLKEALKGLATQEDLKALAPQETVSAVMETVAETKESVTELTGKAGQHILYLFGELCRLANCLPAHLMATATRI